MVSLPDAGFDKTKIDLILFHKELGVLALTLATARLFWRLTNLLPALVNTIPDWQKVAARFIHLCFYGLMIALPMSGLLMSSTAGIPVSFLGILDLPDLIPRNDEAFRAFIDLHKWLAYALIGCTLMHAGAALWHHFIIRDETLRQIVGTRTRSS